MMTRERTSEVARVPLGRRITGSATTSSHACRVRLYPAVA